MRSLHRSRSLQLGRIRDAAAWLTCRLAALQGGVRQQRRQEGGRRHVQHQRQGPRGGWPKHLRSRRTGCWILPVCFVLLSAFSRIQGLWCCWSSNSFLRPRQALLAAHLLWGDGFAAAGQHALARYQLGIRRTPRHTKRLGLHSCVSRFCPCAM